MNRIWFFGILYLCSINLIGAAESKIVEQDFEAVVKRGYYGFLDRVGKEKFKELGLEPIERKIIEEEKPPIEMKITIPLVAQGHEAVYQRFLNGVLIYRPDGKSDNGRINLRISDLVNPLDGTFDLSQCGDAGKYLSISTGYRKGKKAENVNKVEVWLTPRFLVGKELASTAVHFKDIYGNWNENAPVGMFWSWGGWDNLGWYDYLITESMDELSKFNIYENFLKSRHEAWHVRACQCVLPSYIGDEVVMPTSNHYKHQSIVGLGWKHFSCSFCIT